MVAVSKEVINAIVRKRCWMQRPNAAYLPFSKLIFADFERILKRREGPRYDVGLIRACTHLTTDLEWHEAHRGIRYAVSQQVVVFCHPTIDLYANVIRGKKIFSSGEGGVYLRGL